MLNFWYRMTKRLDIPTPTYSSFTAFLSTSKVHRIYYLGFTESKFGILSIQ